MPKDALTVLIAATTQTATFTSTPIDLKSPVVREIDFKAEVTTVSGTAPTLALKIQHSDTSGGTYTDVATFDAASITAAAEAYASVKSARRWARAVGTIGGTAPSYVLSCYAQFGRP